MNLDAFSQQESQKSAKLWGRQGRKAEQTLSHSEKNLSGSAQCPELQGT